MARRRYRMDKRAKAAEETRRRIVAATHALHSEQPIASTTMKEIAARADVALGSVYHHFPTYNDVVRACGEYTFALAEPPTLAVLDGVTGLPARIERLARALFAFYARCPGIGDARRDEDRIPVLREQMAAWDGMLAALVKEALRPDRAAARLAPVVIALFDFEVHRRLVAQGLSTARAAAVTAEVANAWIGANRRAAKSKTH